MLMTYRGILPKVFWLVLTVSVTSVPPASAFGPGEAASGPRSDRPARAVPNPADFVVLIWYRRNDPLGTFQHQTYDVRKGEYTTAVNGWIRDMETKYPSYLVRVRSVNLSRERGETEKLKVGSVIYRELMSVAADSGVFLAAPASIGPGPNAGRSKPPSEPRMHAPDRSFLNPDPARYPINVYPRNRTP